MQDKNTGKTIIKNEFKKYEEITQFVIDKEKAYGHHLFYCSQIDKLVCSSKFKDRFIQHNLIGIDFKEINSEYKFHAIDPALLKFI